MHLLNILAVSSLLSLSWAHAIRGSYDARFRIDSTSHVGASVEYQRSEICETTPGVKSFSGYVNLPSNIIPDLQGGSPYNISTFFWYFEARNDPKNAPLAIYLAGGPGEASSFSVLGESGPCYANKDSNSTTLNPWSFNKYVNMLYIDQPNQVGFSYDIVIPGIFDALNGNIYNVSMEGNETIIPGNFSSQNPETTANTTTGAASALWQFAQVWFTDFPEYLGPKDTVSIWGNSYGGYWTTGTFAYFQDQNAKIANGTLDRDKYKTIHLDTLGITNGCIDLEATADSYVTLPFNNTYGVQLYNETVYNFAKEQLYMPGGCMDQLHQCRAIRDEGDPGDSGNNNTVNSICTNATSFCSSNVLGPFIATGVNQFDISVIGGNPFPPSYPSSFLNQLWVRDALGIPKGLNFTGNSNTVQANFFSPIDGTGDTARRTIATLNSLLSNGVKVAMVYGDRDWKCSWVGAENLTLNAEYPSSSSFRASGYENITTNGSYTGGVVRQYEGFSFSRVFDAGHAVSWYQPETTFHIFTRAMFGKDVATGKLDTGSGSKYSSEGPASSWGFKNVLPPTPTPECSIWNVPGSCSAGQAMALQNGTAVIDNFIVVEPAT